MRPRGRFPLDRLGALNTCKFCQLPDSLQDPQYSGVGFPMKTSFSRTSALMAIPVAIVVSALPGAIRRVAQGGDPYLFTERFFKACGHVFRAQAACDSSCGQPRQFASACGTASGIHEQGRGWRRIGRMSAISFGAGSQTDAQASAVAECGLVVRSHADCGAGADFMGTSVNDYA
jgi:hypothetical protein